MVNVKRASQLRMTPRLRDDDLAHLMAMNTKDLHKLCAKLREDRFLVVFVYPLSVRRSRCLRRTLTPNRHTRAELREGNPRPSNRTWYYINYRHTIDAIKWRVYNIDKEVQGSTVPANEKKEYFCTFCKAEWTAMEVLDSVGPEGFLCHRCRHVLTREVDRHSGGHEQSTRLNEQFKFISELLPKIDAVHIPECDFDRALASARPVVRDETNQRANTIAVDPGTNRPAAVKGLTKTGPQSIAINISTSDGPSEAEKEAERARKEQIAKQNALPAWMSNSTITGESFSASDGTATTAVKAGEEQGASQSKLVDSRTSAQIDDIFARLKAEQAAERAREIEEEGLDSDPEDEDEGDDFEDVPPSGVGTPNTPAVKRQPSGETSRESDSSDERQAKRVKVEPQVKKEEDGDESEEDADVEFEDV